MTVDQTPLPAPAMPLPARWPAAGPDRDRRNGEDAATRMPGDREPLTTLSGWPRIFPGL